MFECHFLANHGFARYFSPTAFPMGTRPSPLADAISFDEYLYPRPSARRGNPFKVPA